MSAVSYTLLHGLAVAGADHPALMSADETLSYGALAHRVSQFMHGLIDAGVTPGDRVAMLMLDTPDIVALHQAAMASGGIAVAVSSRATPDDLAAILAIVKPRIMVIDAAFAPLVEPALTTSAPGSKLLFRDRDLTEWKTREAPPLAPAPRKATDPAFWVMTSGTTGSPKAVEHVHGQVGICGDYYAQVLGTTHTDRLFATSRFHFAYAIGNQFAALRLGATNVLLEGWANSQSVADTLAHFKPTVVLSVPALYHRLLDDGLAATPAFRAVTWYVSAGERMPPQIWTDWEAASGHPILDGLGCSELVYMVIGNTPGVRRPGSSGMAMPGVALRLVDEDGALISAPGISGRLEVNMPSVCAGYRDRTTAAGAPTQRPDERFRGDNWFATGDEYLVDADGFYHHRGRSGDMLRVSGLWVSPAEIEDLLGGLPGLAEAAAILGENDIGLAEIVLAIIPSAGADPAAVIEAARKRLHAALPGYKRPRRFEIVEAMPRTATGKLQRHKLRDALRRSH